MNGLDNWILGDSNGAWSEDEDWTDSDARHEREERAEASAASVAVLVATIADLEADTASRGGWRAIDLRVWRAELALRGGVAS
jgi:hypothetical protein